MSAPNDGGPAFPHPEFSRINDQQRIEILLQSRGMSLRDYFAGQAMAAMISGTSGIKLDGREITNEHGYAAAAYHYAEAMIAAREAKP